MFYVVADLAARMDAMAKQLNDTSRGLQQAIDQVNTDCHDVVSKQMQFVNDKVRFSHFPYINVVQAVMNTMMYL